MNIQPQFQNQNFGCKLNTLSVLECITGKEIKGVKDADRIMTISTVLDMPIKTAEELKTNPFSGYISMISSGKILIERNPQIRPFINKLKDIMRMDKSGIVGDSMIKKFIKDNGEFIDLRI